MDDKIKTLHPAGKSGVNISKAKYDMIKTAIVETLQAEPNLTFTELADRIKAQMAGRFEGSVAWYVVSVKLDLEARGIVERVPETSPQQLRLSGR